MSAAAAERLVHMANQIAGFFVTQPHTDAATGIADHIVAFWDPSMRRDILAHLHATDGAGLAPAALAAVRLLDRTSPRTEQRMAEAQGDPSPGHMLGDDAG